MPLAVCVFLGSASSVDACWFELARSLGRALAQRGDTLVFGGGSVGLMGELARSVKAHGGRVVGVMPRACVEQEKPFADADQMHDVETLAERKRLMQQLADGFLVMPGGIGTLEEMFETLTLRLMGEHEKPMVLLNHAGFYDTLLAFYEELLERRFARARSRNHLRMAAGVEAALDLLAAEAKPTPGHAQSAAR